MAALLDVRPRAIYAWEIGYWCDPGHKRRPAVVPHVVAVLIRLMLRHQIVRMDLGVTLQDDTFTLKRRA